MIDEDNNNKCVIEFDAHQIHSNNPDRNLIASLKIDGEKLSGVYKNISKKEQKTLHLARMKGEKLGRFAESVFLTTSVGATLFASYWTAQYQLNAIKNEERIQAEKLGEGVFTNILNSVFVTYMKQAGKAIPPIPRDGGLLALSAGAAFLERDLLMHNKAPFLFSFTPISALLGTLSKRSKNWVFNKPYGETKGYLTPNFPTDEQLSSCWKGIEEPSRKCTFNTLITYI